MFNLGVAIQQKKRHPKIKLVKINLLLTFVLLFQFIAPSASATAFTLSITSVSSTSDGTNWNYSSGVITLTSNAIISPADLVSFLSVADLTIENSSRTQIDESVISTSASNLTIKSTGNIVILGGVNVQTSGGDVILNSDSDDNGNGKIRLGWKTDLNSGSIITNGGDIILGGGLNPRTGFATSIDTTDGVDSSKPYAGVAIYGFNLDAAGGDINIRGTANHSASTRGVAFDINAKALGSRQASISTTGNGSINVYGKAFKKQTYTNWGINVASETTFSSSSGDILLNGKSEVTAGVTSGNFRGLVVAANQIQSTSGGDITLEDASNGSLSPNNGFYGSGKLTISTSGNFVIKADLYRHDGEIDVTAASTTLIPYTGNDFSDQISLLGKISGTNCNELVMGNSLGTGKAITMNNTVTIGGPISVFATNLTLSKALTSIGGTISIRASGNITQSEAITASNLSLAGGGAYVLQNASNNISTISAGTSGSRIGSLKYTDSSGGLTVATVGSSSGIYSSGLVEISTTSGDLNISAPIVSDLTTGDSVVLYANKSAALGAEGDGNIKLSGDGTVTNATGSRALLYSGARNSSTGLVSLVGGNSNTRSPYEATTSIASITPAVDSTGIFAIFRIAPTAPSAPTINSVTGGSKQLTITFTAPLDGGATISDYEYSLNGGTYTSASTTSSPFTITGLNGRTSYTVTLKARNSVGLSSESSSISGVTTDATLDASEAAAAAEAARVAAAAAEAARVAAAKQQKELTEILSIIPELGKMSLNIGETTKSLTGQKCVKGKTVRYVYKGAKCPKGYVKRK